MADIQISSTAPLYPGPSLPSTSHIRLVHLQPGTEGMIHCELMTSSLDSAPQYEALSYTWGDPSTKESIYMKTQGSESTQMFAVTLNCLLALKRLRYADRPRVLWIDALAIDQTNTHERNHQVSLMSKIYSQAAGVVIYLGESADNSDLAIEFIVECDDPSPETTSLSFPKSDMLMKALRYFFSRPWFTRVWVIQEVFLSAEKTVYCGEETLSWSAIRHFRHYLVNTANKSSLPYVVSVEKGRHSFASLLMWEGEDLEIAERSLGNSLFTALLDSRHCEATDNRDKVYSLLPILDTYSEPLELRPRYQDTTAKAYTDCAIALLPDRGWEVLYAVQGRSKIKNLPTWVPDWSAPPLRQVLGTKDLMEKKRFWKSKKRSAFSETPQVILPKPDSVSEEPTPVLYGYGYPCGRILKVGSTYIAGQTVFPFDEWDELIHSIDPAIHPVRAPRSKFTEHLYSNDFLYGCFESLSELFSDVRHEDEWPERDVDDFFVGKAFSSNEGSNLGVRWHDAIRKLALEKGKGSDYILPFRDIPFYLAGEGLGSSMDFIVSATLETLHSRRCFITDTGYFGFAPADAEIGDHLFVCVGAPIPFALREVETKNEGNWFQLVGESYIEEDAWYALGLKVESQSQPQPLYII